MITAMLVGDEARLARLRAMPDAANSNLVRAIAKLGVDLQRSVQQDKLTGQLLKVRSGSLRSSIGLRLDKAGTTSATVSTDRDYARAHEYGYSGTVNVRASLRRIRRPLADQLPKTISVRAYSRAMDLPEHSFLRSALEDMAPANTIRD